MRTVVIAGASGRLGQFVTREALGRGWRVAALSRDPDRIAGAMREAGEATDAGGRLWPVSASASAPADLARVDAELAQAGWRVDSLVVCVGGWWSGELLALDPGQWRDLFDSHLSAHFLALRQFAPRLSAAGDGAAVLSGGVGTERVVPGSGAISIFGAAQRALLRAVRDEVKGAWRCQEVTILGPLAQDERNEPGDPAVPGEVAASVVGDTLAGRFGERELVRVGPDGPANDLG